MHEAMSNPCRETTDFDILFNEICINMRIKRTLLIGEIRRIELGKVTEEEEV